MPVASGLMDAAARHYAAGRWAEARQCCEAVLQSEPGHADALHLLGVLQLDQGENEAAIVTLETAAARLPGHAQVLYHLGNALLAAERPADAEARYRAALALAPDYQDARNNLGNALMARGRPESAEACFREVVSARPNFPPALFNLGNALAATDQPDEAMVAYRAALAGEARSPDPPRFAQVWQSLGSAMMALARPADALDCYEEALARRPDDLLASWNKGLALLGLGRLREGFALYERRWELPGFAPPEADLQPTPGPRNPNAMRGRRVLLRYEQGAGDTLHFVRYAPLLAARGAEVHLFVQRGLARLLSGVAGIASVTEVGGQPPKCDAVWPLASLPQAFGTELATIPANVPYLSTPADRAAAWQERLGVEPGLRIGLAWSGASGHGLDRFRSIPADRFSRLLRVPGCSFHLLQTEVRDADRAWMAGQPLLTDHGSALEDYTETAAAVSAMDLVISVDTSLAHLAGALGRSVWILLAHSADWRWMMERDDSPWYPTARLFRQQHRGDWDGVLADVEAALRYRPTA
jgi:tetratricopeptide (TPR) repeat protein